MPGRPERHHPVDPQGAPGVAVDVPAKLADVATALNVDPLVWVLTGGDDYALAATFSRGTDLPPPWCPRRYGVGP